MEEIMNFINEEFETFSKSYYGAPILDELIEVKKNIEVWLLKREQQIKDYYWTRYKEDKLTISYSYKSFKLRIVFSPNADIQITLDHNYSHTSKIEDKKIKNSIYADPGYVYFIESEFGWKIGKTRDIVKRNNIFAVKLPFKFVIRYIIKAHNISRLEVELHNIFNCKRINGEWFLITADEIRKCIDTMPGLKLRTFQSKNKADFERIYLDNIK